MASIPSYLKHVTSMSALNLMGCGVSLLLMFFNRQSLTPASMLGSKTLSGSLNIHQNFDKISELRDSNLECIISVSKFLVKRPSVLCVELFNVFV